MIEEKYTPHAIESKWQKYWEDNKAFKTDIDAGKPKSYVLEMFPYLRATCIWGTYAIIPSAT